MAWLQLGRLTRRGRGGLALALLLTSPVWIQFLHPDLDLWATPDGDVHLNRAIQLEQLIRAGAWYSRWLPQHLGGYGYPTLNFYGPAVYYVTIALGGLLPGAGLYVAYQVLGALAALGIVGGSYTLGWRTWRHGPAAVLCATAVAYAPYLIQGNLFERGAVPEALGLGLAMWMLVACHGLWQATTGGGSAGGWWWAVVGLTATLLITHNLSALLAAAMASVWLLALASWRPSLEAAVRAAVAAATGAALTAFFWLPALLGTPLVQIERMQRGPLHYRNWFITWPGYHAESQWGLQERSPWTPGWPIDLHLIYPHGIYGSPKMALWQAVALAAAAAALVCAALATVRRARGGAARAGDAPSPDGAADGRRLILLVAAFGVCLALVSYVLLFDWFLPLWERFPPIRTLQFPMRLLGPTGYGVALAAGGALALWNRPARATWALTLAFAGAIALSGGLGRSARINAEASHTAGAEQIIGQQRLERGWTYGESGEFLPKTADWVEWHEGEARGFWLFGRMFPEASWTGGRVLAWRGSVALRGLTGGPLWTAADVDVAEGPSGAGPTSAGSAQAATVAFHQMSFPGWRAWIDGRPVPIRPAPPIEAQAIQPGFILVDVPPGRHHVAIRFGPDRLHVVAAGISVGALLLLGWRVVPLARRGRGARRVRYAALAAGFGIAVGLAALGTLPPLWPPGGRAPAIVTTSLADEVISGRAVIASPSGAALGADRHVDVRTLAVQAQDRPLRDAGPRAKRWLYMHPPAAASFEVTVPSDVYLQTSLALDPAMWEAPFGDGVRFIATVLPLGGTPGIETTVVDTWLHPRGRGEQRRWVDVMADLRPWAGTRIRLTLRTDARQDPAYDWGGWGEPVLVRLDQITAARMLQSVAQIAALALRP